MKIQLKLFGQLTEVIGKSQLELENINNSDLLVKKILADFPELNKYEFLISVNKKVLREIQYFKSGDEVAFLPPFAGG